LFLFLSSLIPFPPALTVILTEVVVIY